MKLFKGRVLEGFGSSYTVLYRGGLYSCTLRGKFRKILKETHSPIAVGDYIKFSKLKNKDGVIEELLERKNKISRPSKWGPSKEKIMVSNVDHIVAVISAKNPDLKTNLLDRMLLVAERESLQALICINKADLVEKTELDPVLELYTKLRYRIMAVSALSGFGLEDLKDRLKNKFSVFIGQSGVGKTSLLNRIQPNLDLKVQEISRYSNKGKHTTSFVSTFHLDFGGMIADTPGFRDFGLWGVQPEELVYLFREFRRYYDKCRFNPCSHVHEPGCAVREAVSKEKITELRYNSYKKIYNSFKEQKKMKPEY